MNKEEFSLDSQSLNFRELRDEYDAFYFSLLKQGKALSKTTVKGFWGPSHIADMFKVFKAINLENYNRFLDLGSGDGNIVLLASLFTDATGIEIDWELLNTGLEIMQRLGLRANFIQADYYDYSFSGFDVIFVNPDKPFSAGLEQKLLAEMDENVILIVYSYQYQPEFLRRIASFSFEGVKINVYRR